MVRAGAERGGEGREELSHGIDVGVGKQGRSGGGGRLRAKSRSTSTENQQKQAPLGEWREKSLLRTPEVTREI